MRWILKYSRLNKDFLGSGFVPIKVKVPIDDTDEDSDYYCEHNDLLEYETEYAANDNAYYCDHYVYPVFALRHGCGHPRLCVSFWVSVLNFECQCTSRLWRNNLILSDLLLLHLLEPFHFLFLFIVDTVGGWLGFLHQQEFTDSAERFTHLLIPDF